MLGGLILLSEAALAWRSGDLWRRLGRLELVDPALLADHRAAFAPGPRPQALLLGDSVLYGSALRERGDPAWRHHSLGQALQDRFGAKGVETVELSGDGLYPADLAALWATEGRPHLSAVVLELNPRMFADEPGNSATAYSRRFLAPDQPLDAAERVSQASHLFRTCRLASHLLWQPSRIQALTALFNRWMPPSPAAGLDDDLGDALLNLKIRPYYDAPAMGPQHAGWLALQRLADGLKAQGPPVLVFLTPQNHARIADLVDAKGYAANRRLVAELFRSRGLAYRDWADRAPVRGAFLDHCHLDAAGNQELADWALQELPR